jgi:ABC-type uncharacterized transport system substrate-binding protein
MSKKKIGALFFLVCLIIAGFYLWFSRQKPKSAQRILIVIPIAHKENELFLKNFELGFSQKNREQNLILTVKNAQGKSTLLDQFAQGAQLEGYDVILTLGDNACERMSRVITLTPLVCVNVTSNNPLKPNVVPLVTQDSLALFRTYMNILKPDRPIGLVYSEDSRSFVQSLDPLIQEYRLRLEKVKIGRLGDLELLKDNVPKGIGLLLIGRDDTLMYEIPYLVKAAQSLNLPLITMDEGTIYNGASFSFSPLSSLVSQQALDVAFLILKGVTPNQIASQSSPKNTLFINRSFHSTQNYWMKEFENFARYHHMDVKILKTLLEKPNF